MKQTQTDLILEDLRHQEWCCGLMWVRGVPAILRYGARIWDLKARGHHIETRICEHGVGEYRLTFDAERQPVQAALAI